MLHTKFQDLRNLGSREDFLRCFYIYGHGCHLGHGTLTIYTNFCSPLLVICCKFFSPLNDFITVFPIQMHWLAKFGLAIKNVKVNPGSSFIYEPHHKKTGFLHMRKQRRRSASW